MNDATFQRTLQSVLFDNRYDRFVAKRRSGKLNFKGLSKIGHSDKVFKRKEERENKDYSIALLVDCSGSMRGSKAKTAFEAAQKLSKHLASAKINHTVFGFNMPTVQLKPWSVAYDPRIGEKLRFILDKLYAAYGEKKIDGMYPYLGHNMDVKNVRDVQPEKAIGDPYTHFNPVGGSGYNNDSQALRFAAKELMKQPGKKILIVLSDGEPAMFYDGYQSTDFPKEAFKRGDDSQRNMKKIISDIMKMGIDIQSIGIQSDAVNEFYPDGKTCSIYDLGDLYEHIIAIIKLNLKRG